MNFQDILRLGFKDLGDKKLRAALTVLSIVIGIASIIALVSQTTGIQASVVNTLQTLGPTSIFVSPRGTPQGFSQADVARLSTIPGVGSITPIVMSRGTAVIGGQTTSFSIIGISTQGFATLVGQPKMMDGFFYPDTTAQIVVVGNTLIFPVSGGPQQVFTGQTMPTQIGGISRTTTLQVVGLMNTYGSLSFIPIDSAIFMPIGAAQRLLNRMTFNILLVEAVDVGQVSNVLNTLTQIYGNSISATSTQQLTESVSSIIGLFGVLLGSIAAISLTVASVGILNIMFVSVIERTHVIGILKSVGFRDRDVLSLFLSEALIVGILGGLSGIAAGWGMTFLMPILLSGLFSGNAPPSSTQRPPPGFGGGGGGGGGMGGFSSLSYVPIISPEIVLTSFTVAILISIVAGLYPARRASKMDPIKALKYE